MARKDRPEAQPRLDSWENAVSGLGTARDKSTANAWKAPELNADTVRALWAGSGLFATIVDTPPLILGACELRLKLDDPAQKEIVDSELARLRVNEALQRAHEYDRAFGGALIVLVAQSASQLEPLAPNEPILRLLVLSPSEFTLGAIDADIFSPNHELPLTYKLTASALEVHWSRCILWRGARPYNGSVLGQGEVRRAFEAVQRWQAANQNFSAATHELVLRYLKLERLHEHLAAPGGRERVMKKLASIDTYRSMFRTTVLDKTDEFITQGSSMSGVRELSDTLERALIADTRIPRSVLFSDGPTGLNSSTASQNEMKLWAQRLYALRKEKWEPSYNVIVKQLLGANGGLPERWNYELSEIDPLTISDLTAIRKTQSETDKAYLEMGVVTAEEIALSRFGSTSDSFSTEIDVEGRAALNVGSQ